jgi:hypothetical protein
MSHLNPGGETRPAPPLPSSPPDAIQCQLLGIDGFRVRDAIATRRAQIGIIEAEWVIACERDAARGACNSVRLDDRQTWDKAMWDRYLAAAAGRQGEYLPRLLRLYNEIALLEGLLALLPATAGPPA